MNFSFQYSAKENKSQFAQKNISYLHKGPLMHSANAESDAEAVAKPEAKRGLRPSHWPIDQNAEQEKCHVVSTFESVFSIEMNSKVIQSIFLKHLFLSITNLKNY